MKFLLTTTALLCTLLFTGCDETKRVIDVAGSVQLSGAYTVTNLNASKMTTGDLTLNFTALDKSVNGSTGCNTFFGNYTIDYPSLVMGELAVTKKACSTGAMTAESNYLAALNNVGSYGLQNGVLTLYSKGDRSVLITAKKDTQE